MFWLTMPVFKVYLINCQMVQTRERALSSCSHGRAPPLVLLFRVRPTEPPLPFKANGPSMSFLTRPEDGTR
ncbi:hypothetical protein INR49_005561 [Caranx melampygus]|nr:hypothetical protein INR49_005561 [Caranx melampygus]